jgi:hypothetical protein
MANKEEKVIKFTPAGKDDNFEINVMDINQVVELGKNKLKANNIAKVVGLSTELSEGMSIKVYDGGKTIQTTIEER